MPHHNRKKAYKYKAFYIYKPDTSVSSYTSPHSRRHTNTTMSNATNTQINRDINRQINRQINREMDLYILKHIDRLDGLCSDNIDIIDSNTYDFTMNDVKKRASVIKEYRKELDVLLQLPLMKQRTEEWYEARKTRLTASDLYDAIKGNNVSIKLAKKKANIVIDTINYNGIPALKWGTMFEPMATRCYSQKMNDIAIHDFGLVCDTENEHFGASPDGINELGIMLEIKCPYSRKIEDGVIPEKYKMQIQGQLAVCKLKECDYIECVFKSLDSVEEYLALDCDDGNGCDVKHGVIAEYYNSKGEYVYYYSEPNRTPKECVDDICSGDSVNTDKSLKFSKYTYWRLDEMIIQRVVFNAKAWETIVPKINAFWESVEEYKSLPLLPIETGMKKYMFVKDDD